VSTNARLDTDKVVNAPVPISDRVTFMDIEANKPTDSDIKLPDEPSLPTGYKLTVGGNQVYHHVKSFLDCLAAAIILVLSSPFILISALLVKLTSSGPAFYTQMRLGLNGKPYVIYKLRSMYNNCEKQSGIKWCTFRDNRVTPFGRFLRKSHIDELPQLWNVLRGEMSLIGPRPERPELVVSLEKALPRYRDRLLVKPGLTGLAQIQLPPDTDLESVRKKLVLDRVYVNRRSFWLDMRIYMGTIFYLVGLPFAKVQSYFALPDDIKVEKPVEYSVDTSSVPSVPLTVPVLEQA